MRLIHQVAQAAAPVLVHVDGVGDMRLPGADRHALAVLSAEARYVLMDDLTRACGRMIHDQPSLLRDCLDIVRAPASTLWIEFLNPMLLPEGSPPVSGKAQRAGILVETDDGGRRGRIRSFWTDEQHGVDCAPGILEFDFDNPLDVTASRSADPALVDIVSRCRFELDPEWLKYYRLATRGRIGFDQVLAEQHETGWKDMVVFTAFCVLLTMRDELAFSRPDLTRLNQARSRRGKPALVDYVEVAAPLFSTPREDAGARMSGAHRAPRLHHVRGHFVRRSESIFWRRPHLRGSAELGLMPSRVTRMSLGRPPRQLRG